MRVVLKRRLFPALAASLVLATSVALNVGVGVIAVQAASAAAVRLDLPNAPFVKRLSSGNQVFSGTPTVTDAVNLAHNYDIVIAGPFAQYIAQMHAANPALKVLTYVNGAYDQSGGNTTFPDSWYERDPSGNKISSVVWHSWLMNVNNPAWQNTVATKCRDAVASLGYDGCFLDALGTAPFFAGYDSALPINPSTAQLWTTSSWLADAHSLSLAAVAANPGKMIVVNGLGNGPQYAATDGSSTKVLLGGVSGAMAEIFLRTSNDAISNYPTEARWKANVDMLVDAGASGYSPVALTEMWVAGSQEQIDAWHRFSLASFELGSDGNAAFQFVPGTTVATASAPTPWESQNIGIPVNSYAKVGGVYQRTFTNGLVLVNPTAAAVTVPLAGSYTDLSGATQAGSYFMAAHSGNVLLATQPTGSPPVAVLATPDNLTAASATITGAVNPGGLATSWQFNYGPTASYINTTQPATLAASAAQQPVIFNVGGLAAGTAYHYQLVGQNGVGQVATADGTFTTPPLSPTVTSNPATGLGRTTVTLSGTINSGNGATSWWIEYGPDWRYGQKSPVQQLPPGLSPAPVTTILTTLSPATRYYGRLLGSNDSGTIAAPQFTFKTLP